MTGDQRGGGGRDCSNVPGRQLISGFGHVIVLDIALPGRVVMRWSVRVNAPTIDDMGRPGRLATGDVRRRLGPESHHEGGHPID